MREWLIPGVLLAAAAIIYDPQRPALLPVLLGWAIAKATQRRCDCTTLAKAEGQTTDGGTSA